MKAYPCQTCEAYARLHSERARTQLCSKCKKTLKSRLAKRVREEDRIYITERNRGRKPKKLNASQRSDLFYAALRGEKISSLAKRFQISESTVRKYIMTFDRSNF